MCQGCWRISALGSRWGSSLPSGMFSGVGPHCRAATQHLSDQLHNRLCGYRGGGRWQHQRFSWIFLISFMHRQKLQFTSALEGWSSAIRAFSKSSHECQCIMLTVLMKTSRCLKHRVVYGTIFLSLFFLFTIFLSLLSCILPLSTRR